MKCELFKKTAKINIQKISLLRRTKLKKPQTFLDQIDILRKEKFTNPNSLVLPNSEIKPGILSSPPKYAHLNVTNRCNSNCTYCIHAANRKPILSQNDANTEKMKSVLQQIVDLGIESVNFSGGEPLLRPDIFELIHFSEQIGLVSILLSNGLLLPKYWQEFGKTGNHYLILSIDTLDPELFKKQRGVSFKAAWKGFESALKLRDRFPDYVINITATVTKSNLEELPNLVERFSSYGVGIEFSPLHDLGAELKESNVPLDIVLVQKKISELIEMRASGYLILNSDEYLLHFPKFFHNPSQLPESYICRCANQCLYIDATLNIKPCWSQTFPIVGNLENESLQEIWFSPYFEEQRKRVNQLDCDRCWLLCTAEPSLR